MSACKRCNGPAPKLGGAEHRYEVIDYPYNPEWPLTRLDAGIFCSAECLSDYLLNADPTS